MRPTQRGGPDCPVSRRNMMVAGLSSPLLGGGGSGWEKPLAPEGHPSVGSCPQCMGPQCPGHATGHGGCGAPLHPPW